MIRTCLLIVFSLISFSWVEAQNYQTKTDIGYVADPCDDYQRERCKLDLYYPTDVQDFPTIVWFHGGGLTAGHKEIPAPLKNQKFAVVAVNYRLAPKVKSADCIRDAAAAVAWVVQNIEKYGGSKSRIVIAGHSAGAYLTSMVTLDKRWLAPYGIDPDSFMAAAPISGNAFCHIVYRQEQGFDRSKPLVDDMAPIFHCRPDAPPIFFFSGDREMEFMGRYEEIAVFWRTMKLCGHKNCYIYEMQGYDHGGMANPSFPVLLRHLRKLLTTQK